MLGEGLVKAVHSLRGGLMTSYSKLDWCIVALSTIFIVILILSGYFERDVFVLHLFQSLIYVAIIVLSFKHNKWGYGIGISIAVLWNTFNSFSGFVFVAGTRQWSNFLNTGRITNPVDLLALPAYFDHLALIACLVWAYTRLPNKKPGDLGILLASFVGVTVYFMGIIAIFWPQFLRH
jgi:hypothetical protein